MGDRVVNRWTLRGTHAGDIVKLRMAIPGTGRRLSVVNFVGGPKRPRSFLRNVLSLTDRTGLWRSPGVLPRRTTVATTRRAQAPALYVRARRETLARLPEHLEAAGGG